jgi:REP element-mobilizing transposase RayT
MPTASALLELLGEAVERYNWVVHEYELMTNHDHLVIDTPEPTLSRGMQWLNGTYVQWFNKTHDRVGHLFQGRFKGTLVEKETELLNVIRYVALKVKGTEWGPHLPLAAILTGRARSNSMISECLAASKRTRSRGQTFGPRSETLN